MRRDESLILEEGQRILTGIVGEEIVLPTFISGDKKINPVIKSPNGNKTTVFDNTFKAPAPGSYTLTASVKDKVNKVFDEVSYKFDVYPRPIIYSSAPNKKKHSKKTIASNIVIYSILTLFALLILIPFYYAFKSSLTENNPVILKDFTWWPTQVDVGNYVRLFAENDVFRALGNTLLYVIPPILIGTFCSAMCAYATARMNFVGRKFIFYLIILTMFIPGMIILLPSFSLFVNFYHWYPGPLPIIIPALFGGAGCMFFLHQYFLGLPKELEEAAQIDGMSRFTMFTRIIIPISMPAILTQIILSFNGLYNDYMSPLIYLGNRTDLYTIQILINTLTKAGESGQTNYPLLMAGSIVALIPTLILYVCCQKFFVDGIAMSGIKG